MKVINPTPVVDGVFLSSTVAENDYPGWNAANGYPIGERVIRNHRIWESIAAGNVGYDPASSPTYWLNLGPTNGWAMFDQVVGTATVATGSMTFQLQPGGVSALAVVDTNADSVRVVLIVDGVNIYDQTKSTNAGGGQILDWYGYFTADVGKRMVLTFMDLPIYANARVQVTITGADPSGPVMVGTVLLGKVIDLGPTEAGPSIGLTDFSRKETDQFGVTSVLERAWAKRMTIRSMTDTSAVDSIQRKLAGLRARPALWIGQEGYDSLTIFGFFKDFSIDLAFSTKSYCSLTIEGLI